MSNDQVIIDKLDALLTRASRTETRLVRVADKMGIDIRAEKRIEVIGTPSSVVVYIDTLDVTLHEIERALNSEAAYLSLPRGETYHVLIALGQPGNNVHVASIRMHRS